MRRRFLSTVWRRRLSFWSSSNVKALVLFWIPVILAMPWSGVIIHTHTHYTDNNAAADDDMKWVSVLALIGLLEGERVCLKRGGGSRCSHRRLF